MHPYLWLCFRLSARGVWRITLINAHAAKQRSWRLNLWGSESSDTQRRYLNCVSYTLSVERCELSFETPSRHLDTPLLKAALVFIARSGVQLSSHLESWCIKTALIMATDGLSHCVGAKEKPYSAPSR